MATHVTNSQTQDDPYDSASRATVAPRTYYGQIEIEPWYCVLEKGQGKIPFDPQYHKMGERRTAITITVTPLPEQNVSFELRRELIAESREWAGMILPSLVQAGVALGLWPDEETARKSGAVRQIDGLWGMMQQVPSGRTYTDKAGKTKEATTFTFLALYKDEASCRAAYLAESPGDNGAGGRDDAIGTPPNGNGNAAKIATATAFIKAFAQQKRFDLELTRAACRAQKAITDAIDVDSDAFVEIVAEAAAAGSK